MSGDQKKHDEALVTQSTRGLIKSSTGLVRRGLEDLLNRQSRITSSDALPNPEKELAKAIPEQIPAPPRDDPWEQLRGILQELQPPTDVENSLGMGFTLIPAGRFMMGSDAEEDEKPIHEVTISKSFYMGRYPVIQSQWQEIMGNNPSKFIVGDDYPLHGVSWNDSQEFIRKLNLLDARFEYRLPSEAEWEYACRAGTTGDFAGELDLMACCRGVDLQPVGSKSPNAFGLFDMHGSVLEWCEDHYHEDYEGAPTDGTAWISGGVDAKINRVLRGGSFMSVVSLCRSAARSQGIRSASAGLRLVAVEK